MKEQLDGFLIIYYSLNEKRPEKEGKAQSDQSWSTIRCPSVCLCENENEKQSMNVIFQWNSS